ncbi:MAG: LysE family translocator [Aquiluna sp.]|jgi:homoserine/homoserine lactone efflux protein
MDLQTWLLYTLAAVGLSLTPGPNGLLALTHGALYGTRKTIFTILGGSVGFTAVIGLSMFGIGALLAANVGLLVVLKWLGGAYLVFLGIQVWRSPSLTESRTEVKSASGGKLFQAGLLSAISNPKGILFFVAFLPQFIEPAGSILIQFLIMAATFVVIEFFYELLVASLADKIQPWLRRVGKNFNRVFGSVFIAIGALLPLRG